MADLGSTPGEPRHRGSPRFRTNELFPIPTTGPIIVGDLWRLQEVNPR